MARFDPVPDIRIHTVGDAPVAAGRGYVVYWMTAFRRARCNFALQRAVGWCRELGKPLLVLDALRHDYQWACDRFHAFIIAGMRDNLADAGVTAEGGDAANRHRALTWYPYAEPEPGAQRGMLRAIAARACVVVTDCYPTFFHPAMIAGVAEWLDVRFEQVDSNGLFPLAAGDRARPTAHSFRRQLQAELLPHLLQPPMDDPLSALPDVASPVLPAEVRRKWPPTSHATLADPSELIAGLPIDHTIAPVDAIPGGARPARAHAKAFVADRVARYGEDRNHPDDDGSSGLSPYLHFGHISVHEVFDRIVRHESWTPAQLSDDTSGSRSGWWGMTAAAESFLDELITWRELGYHFAWFEPRHDQYDTLPDWAQATLADHADDPREHVYTLEEFAAAQTHDSLWNAAQRQLRLEGRIHNYLRMVWGKKILEWTRTPQDALEVMIELNNRYALDGRDPNSYSGIFWVLGRFDRAWGPEREIYGKVRYMALANTRKKVRCKAYLKRWGPQAAQGSLFGDD